MWRYGRTAKKRNGKGHQCCFRSCLMTCFVRWPISMSTYGCTFISFYRPRYRMRLPVRHIAYKRTGDFARVCWNFYMSSTKPFAQCHRMHISVALVWRTGLEIDRSAVWRLLNNKLSTSSEGKHKRVFQGHADQNDLWAWLFCLRYRPTDLTECECSDPK